MDHRPLHLHSMLVHAVVGLAPLAAAACLLDLGSVRIGPAGPETWDFVLRGALAAMFLVAVPSTVTGISERNHMYANWPPSHRAKLVLSLILLGLCGLESAALALAGSASSLGALFAAAVVAGNCLVALALAHLGLRITLGRQGFGRPSYVPDADREPPVDILTTVAAHAAEPPRLIDVREESGS